MFGISWLEILVIAGVALVVIGPQDLPRVLYAAGKLVRKARILTADIQRSIDGIIREEELADIVREANKPGGENLQQMIEDQLQAETKPRPAAQDGRDGADG